MSRTVISFDIGIKNLAYCVFTINETAVIRDWGVINLLTTDTSTADPTCNCQKAKSGICGKKATFWEGINYYCKTHSKTSGKILPSKETSMPSIKKLKMNELTQFCANYFISIGEKDRKPNILQKVQTHFEKIILKPIVKQKNKNANQLHLVDIGKRIKTIFDEKFQPFMEELSHVILENQISPIAGRMNTIQGMVAQYFIMKTDELIIDFVSSAGKLKGLVTNENSTYKDHKKDGIVICTRFLDSNPAFTPYKKVFESIVKKDDMADCFLQGIYYFKKQNIINYSDDLIIKTI